jgi:hypothetical protein
MEQRADGDGERDAAGIAQSSGSRSTSSSSGFSSPRSATTTMAKMATMVVETASTIKVVALPLRSAGFTNRVMRE